MTTATITFEFLTTAETLNTELHGFCFTEQQV